MEVGLNSLIFNCESSSIVSYPSKFPNIYLVSNKVASGCFSKLLLLSGLTVNKLILPAIRKANLIVGNIACDVVSTAIFGSAAAPLFVNLSNEILRPIKALAVFIN